MGGIRKVSHSHQLQDFRSRLQRALSLSSSESDKTSSPSASEAGDTTEDEVLQDGNNSSNDQENSNPVAKHRFNSDLVAKHQNIFSWVLFALPRIAAFKLRRNP
ncbi:hypothetical protein MYU51_018729 [Penicillium brevicompactum]